MCTPELLEELAVGWLHGEGYIATVDDVRLRPCATDLGFWAEISAERAAAVAAEGRRPVLASGCGAVATFLADPATIDVRPARARAPAGEVLRALLKELFARGERYQDTGGIHAAALTDGISLKWHAEDIGRHNAVDKVIGFALLRELLPLDRHILMVSGRASFEIMQKALAGRIAMVAAVSAPSTLAVQFARASGQTLVGFLRGNRMNVYSRPKRIRFE